MDGKAPAARTVTSLYGDETAEFRAWGKLLRANTWLGHQVAHTVSIAVGLCAILMAGCIRGSQDAPETEPAFIPTDCLAGLNGVDLNLATIADLQAALTEGRFTSLQLVDAYIARIAAFDQVDSTGPLNAVREVSATARERASDLDAERAAGNVRGPLHGIPILLKDNINTFDEPTTAGSIALANNVPPKDATVTQRLREAGMIILGKTNMVEFASMMTSHPLEPDGYSSLGGQVINAYTGGNPAGSSSGSGVGGSMAFAAITLGTETDASITGPSIFNSLVGLKTTTGLVSRHGVIPLALSFDTVGPMGRNVVDLAAVLDAMAGTDPFDDRTADADTHLPPEGFGHGLTGEALRGARIGYQVGTEEAPLFGQALAVLERSGATLVPFDAQASTLYLGSGLHFYNEFKFGINRYLANDAGPQAGASDLTDIILYNQEHMERVPYGQDELIAADATPGDSTLASLSTIPQTIAHQAMVDAIFEENHLDAIADVGAFLGPGDFIGYPTLVVPMGYETVALRVGYQDNTPQGFAFFGQAWSDGRLLAYGYAYEQASHARIPPTVLNAALLDNICT